MITNAAPAAQPAGESILDSIANAMAGFPRVQRLGLSSYFATPETGIKVDVDHERWLIIHPHTFHRITIAAARNSGPNDILDDYRMIPLMGLTPVDLAVDQLAFVRIAAALARNLEKPAPLA